MRDSQKPESPDELTLTFDISIVLNSTDRPQNTLENLPFFLSGMFMAGLRMPLASACCGGLWLAGRLMYTIGYWQDPKKRTPGFILSLLGGQFPLLFMSIYSGLGLLGWC